MNKNFFCTLFFLLFCASAFSMDKKIAQAACEEAAIKQFNSVRKDQYGNTLGTKIEGISIAVTYDKNLTRQLGFGNNYLTKMSIWGSRYERGRYGERFNIDIDCITNDKYTVIGMEY